MKHLWADTEDIRKQLEFANREYDRAIIALNAITRLTYDNPERYGAELGRAIEIARSAHTELTKVTPASS